MMRSVPMLPCDSIDAVERQWVALGFHAAFRQDEPRGYVKFTHSSGAELHYFHDRDHDRENSSATCLLIVDDPEKLFAQWSAVIDAAVGATLAVPHTDDTGRVIGFGLIDSAGNRLRVVSAAVDESDDLDESVPPVLAPPDPDTAVTSLPAPAEGLNVDVARVGVAVAPHHRFSALIYLAELSLRLGRLDEARQHISAAEAIMPDAPQIAAIRTSLLS